MLSSSRICVRITKREIPEFLSASQNSPSNAPKSGGYVCVMYGRENCGSPSSLGAFLTLINKARPVNLELATAWEYCRGRVGNSRAQPRSL